VPILLAGLGGLFAERSGVINIGLEGMMILGTWFGAWGAWMYGPWWGVLAALIGGALGGLLHAVATVTFGVDHIISGVAINILAGGVARFLSVITYVGKGAVARRSPPGSPARIADGRPALPRRRDAVRLADAGRARPARAAGLAGVSDLAVAPAGLTGERLAGSRVLAVLLVPLTWFFLWRTPLGLRMRSVGEHPVAAESLGVRVYTMKYLGVTISGALAGLGRCLPGAGGRRHLPGGQTGGRGFIGLAAMIFGNWRPGGVARGRGPVRLRRRPAAARRGCRARPAAARRGGAVLVRLLVAVPTPGRGGGPARGRRPPSCLVGWSTDTVPARVRLRTPHLTTLSSWRSPPSGCARRRRIGMPYRKGESGSGDGH
jgi:general nucleoside transport system permease protein